MTAVTKPPRLKLVAPVVSEDELHCSVSDLLDFAVAPPAMWTCFPAGNVPLPPEYAAKLARMGLHAGWPDFLIVHRGIFGVELKRTANGVLSRTRTVRTTRRPARGRGSVRACFPVSSRCRHAHRDLPQRGWRSVLAALADWQVPLGSASDAADARNGRHRMTPWPRHARTRFPTQSGGAKAAMKALAPFPNDVKCFEVTAVWGWHGLAGSRGARKRCEALAFRLRL